MLEIFFLNLEDKYWVHKNDEVLKEDFRSLRVVSKLFMHIDWRDIIKFLEEHFQINTGLNPLFEHKALIRSSSGKLEDLIKNRGKWSIWAFLPSNQKLEQIQAW